MKYYIKAIRNYAVFKGRARRKEFWLFTLIDTLFLLLTFLLDHLLGTNKTNHNGFIIYHKGYILSTYAVALLMPRLALIARRWHDLGKSGWWTLLIAIPIVGTIVTTIYFVLPGTKGYNDYGADPKEEEYHPY